MDDVLEALAAQHDELEALVAGLDETGWHRPSRCQGWDVADVVLHLSQTDELATASVEGRFDEGFATFVAGLEATTDVESGAGLAVARDRGAPGAEVLARWRAAAAAERAAFAAQDPRARVTWVAGELAARTLATTRLAECWIHTEDVAAGLGVELEPTDRLWHIARLAWRTVPHAFARHGLCAPASVGFDLVGPDGQPWRFPDDLDGVSTIVTGSALGLCRVAGQRASASDVDLQASGPGGHDVLRLVRTFA